jgi:hypothetical protein
MQVVLPQSGFGEEDAEIYIMVSKFVAPPQVCARSVAPSNSGVAVHTYTWPGYPLGHKLYEGAPLVSRIIDGPPRTILVAMSAHWAFASERKQRNFWDEYKTEATDFGDFKVLLNLNVQ